MYAKRNNKGMTLLELIISMAISIIVVLMIISFISAAFRVFRKTNDDVKLQMEAQTAMNQIVNIAMEAKSIVKDNLVTNPQDERYLIDNIDGVKDYAIIYRKDLNKLYLVTMEPSETVSGIGFDGQEEHFNQEYLLTEYVAEFNITDAGGNGVKKITMKLQLGQEEFEISKQVILRNAP